MRSSWSSATTPPLEGGSSCAAKDGVKASEMEKMKATERNCRRTDPPEWVRLEGNGVGNTMSLRSIPQRNLAAGGAKIGVPVPQIQCHAGCGQRVRDHYSPEGEQLVGSLREHLEQPVKQHLEDQKDRKQGVPHYRVAHAPVDQHDQTHPEQREDGEVERGVDEYGPKDQMAGIWSGITEQDDLPQQARGLKGVSRDGIEEEKPGGD